MPLSLLFPSYLLLQPLHRPYYTRHYLRNPFLLPNSSLLEPFPVSARDLICYRHFTQLTATAPFAVLGLVLMACTARVCRITGITDLYEEIASEDMKMVGEMLDDGAVEEELGSLLIGGGEEEVS